MTTNESTKVETAPLDGAANKPMAIPPDIEKAVLEILERWQREGRFGAFPPPPPPRGFMNAEEVAPLLKMTTRTLWRKVRDGIIPAIRTPNGRAVVFEWPAVHAAYLRYQRGGV